MQSIFVFILNVAVWAQSMFVCPALLLLNLILQKYQVYGSRFVSPFSRPPIPILAVFLRDVPRFAWHSGILLVRSLTFMCGESMVSSVLISTYLPSIGVTAQG